MPEFAGTGASTGVRDGGSQLGGGPGLASTDGGAVGRGGVVCVGGGGGAHPSRLGLVRSGQLRGLPDGGGGGSSASGGLGLGGLPCVGVSQVEVS